MREPMTVQTNIKEILRDGLYNNNLDGRVTFWHVYVLGCATRADEAVGCMTELFDLMALSGFATDYDWRDIPDYVTSSLFRLDVERAIKNIVSHELMFRERPKNAEELKKFLSSIKFCYFLEDYLRHEDDKFLLEKI